MTKCRPKIVQISKTKFHDALQLDRKIYSDIFHEKNIVSDTKTHSERISPKKVVLNPVELVLKFQVFDEILPKFLFEVNNSFFKENIILHFPAKLQVRL